MDLESNQVSLTSQTMLLLPTGLGASSERQSPKSLLTGSVPRGRLSQDWETLSHRSVLAFPQGAWRVGGGWASAWEAGRTPSLGSSICWCFVNSWLLYRHPPTAFPEKKKRQNILAAQANGSQMTEVKKQNRTKKFCNMLLFKSKKQVAHFSVLGFPCPLWSCPSCETFCCLHFHYRRGKIRRMGHSELLHNLSSFCCRPAVAHLPQSQANRSRRRWLALQNMGCREEAGEPRIWRGRQACSVDRECSRRGLELT